MHLLRLTFRSQLSSAETICVSPFASRRIGHASSKNALNFSSARTTIHVRWRCASIPCLCLETEARRRRAGPGNDRELRIGLGDTAFPHHQAHSRYPSISLRAEQAIWLCLALKADRPVAVYSCTAGIRKPGCSSLPFRGHFLAEPVQVNQVRPSLILMQGFA
jgi:hypothetical protein